jgi:hypothetical protein
MNNKERREYWKSWSVFALKQERYWLPKIYKALKSNNDAFAAYLRKYGVRDAIASIDSIVSMEPIMTVLQSLYVQVGVKRGRLVLQQIKKDSQKARGTMGLNEELTRDILKYFELNLLNKSVIPITQTQKDAIRKVLEQGVEKGLGVEDLAKLIQGMPYTRNHARLVVTTEVPRAANASAELSANNSELELEKEWISAHDSRVRRPPKSRFDHVHMDGVTVGSNKPFNVSGEQLMYPGDPNGSAGNVIRCRCVVAYVPKRDAAGRIIRKPKPVASVISNTAPSQPVEVPQVGNFSPSPVATIASGLVAAAIAEAISEIFE